MVEVDHGDIAALSEALSFAPMDQTPETALPSLPGDSAAEKGLLPLVMPDQGQRI
jgi:hypothetical protein